MNKILLLVIFLLFSSVCYSKDLNKASDSDYLDGKDGSYYTNASNFTGVYSGGISTNTSVTVNNLPIRRYLIADSAVTSSVTGTTNETVLATVNLPAGSMGSKGQLIITSLWSCTNSSNNKTFKVKLGGVSFQNVTRTTSASAHDIVYIRNRTASNQIAFAATSPTYGGTAGAINSQTINTAAATTITWTGQLATDTETIQLEAYTVEVIYND